MGKSYKARFDGNAKEVVEYCRAWGRFKTMDKYQLKDYPAFCQFLEDQTNNKDLGLHPILAGETGDIRAENLLNAFITRLGKADAKVAALEAELQQVKLQREYERGQRQIEIEARVQQILQLCKE